MSNNTSQSMLDLAFAPNTTVNFISQLDLVQGVMQFQIIGKEWRTLRVTDSVSNFMCIYGATGHCSPGSSFSGHQSLIR
jgi:hypothetical protein